ncbi:MAG: ABC transporter ATP-binding protein [Clostridiales bacterium]|nr:ABC transporter ATP-binding protein [Clostridiales bacterium]
MKKAKKKGVLARILQYVGKYPFALIGSILFSLVSVGATLFIPVFFGDAIDCIVEAGKVDFDGLKGLFIKTGAFVLLSALCQWLAGLCNNKISCQVVRDLRADAFAKISKLPLKYIDSHPHGDTVSRVIADADQFSDGLLMGFTQFFTGVVTILGTLAFMLFTNPKIGLAVVVLTPLSIFIARFVATHTHKFFVEQTGTRGEQTAFVEEAISGLKTTQAFAHEDENQEKFDEINKRLEKASLKATFYSSLTNPSTRVINNLVYAVVALIGALDVARGVTVFGAVFTVGGLTKFLSYTNQYTKPFNEISGVITELKSAFACASRIFELIDEEEEVLDKGKRELGEVNGEVSLQNVYFSYAPNRKLIEDLSVYAPKGTRVAIVGRTGSGKTTLINLLMRFYDVDGGAVCVDGHDVRTVTRPSLRKNFGMVLQETWLKSGTVKENLRLGNEQATDEEIIRASKATRAHGFIQRMEKGYDTPLSEEGGNLSEGQKQLLCITRVMLRLPPMLILDEATSSIDTRTELKISEAFGKLMEGRTTFIVAHRLSTVMHADMILVMENGKVVEQGKHNELLQKGGAYATLYNGQFS